ncbi:MAG: hypothetical protein ACI9JM_003191 [Halioglobus sp.]|jgi:hypothetical protein
MAAKILITLATLLYAVAPLIADLNDSHVLHPEWPPHARVHMVWLLAVNHLVAWVALYLLWVRSEVVLAAVLGLCVYGGFWISALTRNSYGGAYTDEGGVDITIMGFDANAFTFSVALAVLLLGLFLHLRKKAP